MDTIPKSPFKLEQFVIKEFSIKREAKEKGKIDIDIAPSGLIDKQNKSFLLTLHVTLKDDTESFDINMTAFGNFDFVDIESLDNLSNYFYVNAPALIFPFIRSYISAITALSGLETIYLPIMNLSSLITRLKENTIEIDEAEIKPE